MLDEVNMVEYGLTCSIWTNDISTAHRTAVTGRGGASWINEVAKHFLGMPFGGVQAERHRPRGMLRGNARLHAGKEHPREAAARESLIPKSGNRFRTRSAQQEA